MEEKSLSFFNSIAAFIIAILTGLGVGSGGLFVAYLTAIGHAGEVRGLNLLFFILSASIATLLNIKSRKFDLKLVFIMGACGIVGCLVGTGISNFISSETVKKIFGGMLIFSGAYVLFSGTKAKKTAKISKNRRIV